MKEDAAAFAVVDGEYALASPKLFIPADTSRYYGGQALLKRAMDLVVGSLMLLVASPLMLVIAILGLGVARAPKDPMQAVLEPETARDLPAVYWLEGRERDGIVEPDEYEAAQRAVIDAILDYRKDAGRISDPVQLVAANVLSKEKFLAIAAFLVVLDQIPQPFNSSDQIFTG